MDGLQSAVFQFMFLKPININIKYYIQVYKIKYILNKYVSLFI